MDAVISRVDWTNTSLRRIKENLLTLLATIMDVGDINLFNAKALVLSKNPNKEESITTHIDLISGR